MKKIAVITCVKNECDIIESFCRYNLTFCDMMLIHECRKSSDNTREIIQKLIDEGLPIFFEAEEDMFYEAAKKVLARVAVEKYGADLVVQLDADEFLCHTDGINPRETLEQAGDDIEYQIPWRTYVYTAGSGAEEEPKEGSKGIFVPALYPRYRNPALEAAGRHAGKTLLSRCLLTEKQAEYIEGAHWLIYPKEYEGTVEIKVSDKLFCAHYPIRSKHQAMSKIIPSWINRWIQPEHDRPPRVPDATFQYDILFNIIEERGELTAEIMRHESLTYSLYNLGDKKEIDGLLRTLGDEITVEGAIDTAFCGDRLTLRYTGAYDADKAFMRATLMTIDTALQYLDAESRTKTEKIAELYREIGNVNEHRAYLEKTIEDIYNSPTWRFGERAARLYRFFVRKKPGGTG